MVICVKRLMCSRLDTELSIGAVLTTTGIYAGANHYNGAARAIVRKEDTENGFEI